MTDDALARALREVARARLQPDDWDEVGRHLAAIESGTGTVEDLTRTLFEAQVRGRFRGARTGADVAPTKQTSVLPVVGLVCGALLFGMGALLGGGVILVGIAGLALFVFGVAFAGSRVAHRRQPDGPDPTPPATRLPDSVAAILDRLDRREPPCE